MNILLIIVGIPAIIIQLVWLIELNPLGLLMIPTLPGLIFAIIEMIKEI